MKNMMILWRLGLPVLLQAWIDHRSGLPISPDTVFKGIERVSRAGNRRFLLAPEYPARDGRGDQAHGTLSLKDDVFKVIPFSVQNRGSRGYWYAAESDRLRGL
jgi:hypothetical protein